MYHDLLQNMAVICRMRIQTYWLEMTFLGMYNILTVPRTNTRLGERSFSVAGLRIWNSLPASLRQPDIAFGHFK